jgi:hypothetical protein
MTGAVDDQHKPVLAHPLVRDAERQCVQSTVARLTLDAAG